jgi:hypothetical protein
MPITPAAPSAWSRTPAAAAARSASSDAAPNAGPP